MEILQDMLTEQQEIVKEPQIQHLIKQIRNTFCGC
jgi:hypothetical protein